MTRTPYFYAAAPHAIVAAAPTPNGVELSITFPCDDSAPGAVCLMRPDQFEEFLAAGSQILAETYALSAHREH
ncbi:hypothetical protein HUO13_35635 [Saccharopolyspora erythraea]|uniref:hypothetical protein n=1 Tax=Saccharopolyspora erythraea TaxID=1836 RepID=UPI001BA8A8C1|nr:hypothetical protein [Saccharopolyspora erythraea]QUH05406.1 hypothetical protein HUO13_35635 [Saccharopolyspora erythraea]